MEKLIYSFWILVYIYLLFVRWRLHDFPLWCSTSNFINREILSGMSSVFKFSPHFENHVAKPQRNWWTYSLYGISFLVKMQCSFLNLWHPGCTDVNTFRSVFLFFAQWCELFHLGYADGKPGDVAELFERVSQNVKVKRYSEALDDLNAAIEADPTLSEAYWHRASIQRQLCRFLFTDCLFYFYKLLFLCSWKARVYYQFLTLWLNIVSCRVGFR